MSRMSAGIPGHEMDLAGCSICFMFGVCLKQKHFSTGEACIFKNAYVKKLMSSEFRCKTNEIKGWYAGCGMFNETER